MNCYEFMLEYIRILRLAKSRGYPIADSKQKVLTYRDTIAQRVDLDVTGDALEKACQRLYTALGNRNAVLQDQNILTSLGITEDPEVVLYDDIEYALPYYRALVFAHYYDDEVYHTWRSHSNGVGEYFSVQSTNCREAFKELSRLYNTKTFHISEVAKVEYIPPTRMYSYRGRLYPALKEKGGRVNG